MASFTDKQIGPFAPYVPTLPVQAIVAGMEMKRQEYEKNFLMAQQYVSQVKNLNLLPKYQPYLNQKLASLQENAKKLSGADFSNPAVLSEIEGYVDNIASDPIIKHAVYMTDQVTSQMKEVEEMYKKNGAAALPNYAEFMDKYQQWLNDGDLHSDFNYRYVPYVDYTKSITKILDQVMREKGIHEVPYKTDALGNILKDPKTGLPLINEAMVKRSGLTPDQIYQALLNGLNEGEKEQIRLEGRYALRDIKDPSEFAKLVSENTDNSIKTIQAKLKEIDDAKKKVIGKKAGEELQYYDNLEKMLKSRLQSLQLEKDELVNEAAKNPDKVKGDLYLQRKLFDLAATYSAMSQQEEYVNNPFFQAQIAKQRIALEAENVKINAARLAMQREEFEWRKKMDLIKAGITDTGNEYYNPPISVGVPKSKLPDKSDLSPSVLVGDFYDKMKSELSNDENIRELIKRRKLGDDITTVDDLLKYLDKHKNDIEQNPNKYPGLKDAYDIYKKYKSKIDVINKMIDDHYKDIIANHGDEIIDSNKYGTLKVKDFYGIRNDLASSIPVLIKNLENSLGVKIGKVSVDSNVIGDKSYLTVYLYDTNGKLTKSHVYDISAIRKKYINVSPSQFGAIAFGSFKEILKNDGYEVQSPENTYVGSYGTPYVSNEEIYNSYKQKLNQNAGINEANKQFEERMTNFYPVYPILQFPLKLTDKKFSDKIKGITNAILDNYEMTSKLGDLKVLAVENDGTPSLGNWIRIKRSELENFRGDKLESANLVTDQNDGKVYLVLTGVGGTGSNKKGNTIAIPLSSEVVSTYFPDFSYVPKGDAIDVDRQIAIVKSVFPDNGTTNAFLYSDPKSAYEHAYYTDNPGLNTINKNLKDYHIHIDFEDYGSNYLPVFTVYDVKNGKYHRIDLLDKQYLFGSNSENLFLLDKNTFNPDLFLSNISPVVNDDFISKLINK